MSRAQRVRAGLLIVVALLIAATGIAYALGGRPLADKSASPFVTCRVVGNAVQVTFRGSAPTMFQIDDPQQVSYALVDPAQKLNLVGKAYAAEFRLPIASQQGVAADGSRRLVFTKPGRYRLLFQDANTFAGAELRRFSCDVAIEQAASRARVAGAAEVALDARGETALFQLTAIMSPDVARAIDLAAR